MSYLISIGLTDEVLVILIDYGLVFVYIGSTGGLSNTDEVFVNTT